MNTVMPGDTTVSQVTRYVGIPQLECPAIHNYCRQRVQSQYTSRDQQRKTPNVGTSGPTWLQVGGTPWEDVRN